MAAKVFLFDLDGTLWHSQPWYARQLADLSNHHYRELLDCLAAGENVVKLSKRLGIHSSFKHNLTKNTNTLVLYDGVLDTIHELKRRGNVIGVVSNLPKWLASPMLQEKQLNVLFDTVVTWMHGKAKPGPGGINFALDNLGLYSSEQHTIWYIGDTNDDGRAALKAGVKFAWVSYGYGQLRPKDATAVIDEFRKVLDL